MTSSGKHIGKTIAAMTLGVAFAFPASAEMVDVKYWGAVDLDDYECTDTTSSFVHRICYDESAAHLVALLNDTYYAYCQMDSGTVENWLLSESKGRFYNQRITNDAAGGRFSCG